jgi:hypothetical protein
LALAEISHTIARHSAEKASGFKVLMAFALVAELCGLDIGISRAAATLLLSLPNSRKMETEADHMGAWCPCLSCAPSLMLSQAWSSCPRRASTRARRHM